MHPGTLPKLTAMAVAAAMLASLLYITRISSQYTKVSAAEVQDRSDQYHQRVQQEISQTEKDMASSR